VLEGGPALPPEFLNFIQKLALRNLSSPGLFLEQAEGPVRLAEIKPQVIITSKGKEKLQSGELKGKNRELLDLVSQKSPVSCLFKKEA